MINHATVLLEIGGVTILTDPIYSWTIGFIIPRFRKPGILFNDLPPIDVVLISHNHHDHLNLRTLRRLRRKRQSMVIVPPGLRTYVHRAGFENIRELNWWEGSICGDVVIHSVPAKHWGKRTVWEGEVGYCGYVVEGNGESIYFAGDTGYGSHFAEIGRRFSLEVALLPIGAYKPYAWFKNIHLNPSTAVRAFADLGAKHLVPIHWGTFKISDEPLGEPPRLLEEEAGRVEISPRLHILRNGESFNP
jgi:L-ascorbate metabolism protein UlaG (beta-lactamase superfamily)